MRIDPSARVARCRWASCSWWTWRAASASRRASRQGCVPRRPSPSTCPSPRWCDGVGARRQGESWELWTVVACAATSSLQCRLLPRAAQRTYLLSPLPPLLLLVQGMCINARADPNATHVPFRDSKLTRLLQVRGDVMQGRCARGGWSTRDSAARVLPSTADLLTVLVPRSCPLNRRSSFLFSDLLLTLILRCPSPQDSLGGNAKTSLLVAACDAQEHVEETLQTLQFGARAMCVRIQVRQGTDALWAAGRWVGGALRAAALSCTFPPQFPSCPLKTRATRLAPPLPLP